MNKAFVEAFKKANNGLRPNFMAVGGYDGMHLIYEALKKTGGKTDGDALIAAMKGMKLGEPARADLDRSRDARHRAEHLHPQGREGRTASSTTSSSRPSRREGSGEGRQEVADGDGRTRPQCTPCNGGEPRSRGWMRVSAC